ncbi:hypothetical protein SETIT_9G166600v2 [Setaria italica]|uniref:TF-B3 domain-containing protein n=1 Tax=Setaria italica TaxID=4555 RepID=A0A368SHE1_SETIT|nr:hypothetical protein SETIT_9G166600v2 [Setaria italica]
MGSSCRRCKLRAENAYKNLDDHQKYFLMLMKGDFQQAMTIPGELVERFRCEILTQITLRTCNSCALKCNCSTVEVAKCPDKIVISAGWAAFVDTYDLHLHGSVLFRYGENSEFYVVIFDQFGCEEVLSVLEDYSHLPPHDPERCIDATEAVKCYCPDDIEYVNPPYDHPESETMQMRSPQREGHTPLQTDSTTQGIKIMLHLDVQRTCRDDIESVTPAHEHARTKTMQMRSLPWERQTSLQRDSITQDNKTMPHLDNFPKQYIVRHLGRKERTIFLQRDSQRYQAKLNIGAVAKLSQGGWRRFVKANGIEVGDICLFELLKDGETCTMNVHIIRSYEVAD